MLGAALVAAVLAGCAAGVTKETPVETKRELVKARAQERWNLLIKKDPAAAYDYLSKGSKQGISRDEFATRMSKIDYQTAKVDSVECQTEVCRVTVSFTYDFKLMKGMPNFAKEDWIIEDGQFRYVWAL